MDGLKELSSKWTFTLKYIYPCIWFLGVPLIYLVIVGFEGLYPTQVKGAFYVMWLMVGVLYTVTFFDIKQVGLEKDFLYVTDYEKDITITLDKIDNVIEKNMGFFGRRLTVLFSEETEFGKSISFMGIAQVMNDPGIPHPAINEIKTASKEYKYYQSFAEQEKARTEKRDMFGYF